jgi:uracil-DNA glycosylase
VTDVDGEILFGKSWYNALKPVLQSEYFNKLTWYIKERLRLRKQIYPSSDSVWKAFRLTPLEDVKIVILGQDPYHTPGMATGLAFGVPDSCIKLPPSLRNILKEVEEDLGEMRLSPDITLESWAKQGVLLINTALTVEKGDPGCHADMWRHFTQNVLKTLSEERAAVVYLLWGAHAKSYIPHIQKESNFILTAAHPSPFSAHKGWFGCKHFTKANEILTEVAKSLDKDPEDYIIKW